MATDEPVGDVPRHVAIIMDGNGRWANRRGLPRRRGHEAGEKALLDTVEGAVDLGIGYLTVYAFSTENWKRPPAEVRFLMNFNRTLLRRRVDELDERDVRVLFIGSRATPPVPRVLVRLMAETEERTADNGTMTLCVAFNYGSQDEIVRAARRLAEDHAAGRAAALDRGALEERLYDPDMPPVDLLVRTSGEKRLSNFLLWQSAYAEIVFTDVLWPDFDRHGLGAAVDEYRARERRFGDATDAAGDDVG